MSYFTAQLGEAVRIAEAHLIAARFTRENERMAQMGRLDEKWAAAGGVVASIEQEIESNLDALIARRAEVSTKTRLVFAKQNAPIDDANKALDALDRKLDLLSNGAPEGPLPGSGSSPEVGQTATFQAGGEAKTTGAA